MQLNAKNILLPAVLVGAAFLVYRNFTNFKKTFTATIGRVTFDLKETQRNLFLKLVFNVFITVDNPSRFTGEVRGIKLDVLLNGQSVGSVNQSGTRITLQSENRTVIPVNIGLNTLSLFPTINAAIQAFKNRTPIKFQVVGTILTNYGTVDINENETVNL
jgi:LEA14-like dessication related protein